MLFLYDPLYSLLRNGVKTENLKVLVEKKVMEEGGAMVIFCVLTG